MRTVRTMRNKTWIATARHFDQQSDAFFLFPQMTSLHITLREFKIEKEKRVSRDRSEFASPERNSRIGRTNNFLAIKLFLSLLCVLSLFTNGNQRKQRFCETANTRNFCQVNDNISSFFSVLVFFFSFFKSFFSLHFENSLSLVCPFISFYLSISSSPFRSPGNLRNCQSR